MRVGRYSSFPLEGGIRIDPWRYIDFYCRVWLVETVQNMENDDSNYMKEL
jgi:hypothetical protein